MDFEGTYINMKERERLETYP